MCGAPVQELDRAGLDGQTVIQGIVRRDDQPVAGAYVRLLDEGGDFTAEVVTSPAGAFRFFVAPGTWTLRALAPGGTGQTTAHPADKEIVDTTITLD